MKINYIRDVKDKSTGQVVVTTCSEYNKEEGKIYLAIAVCSKNDIFEKRIGKYIARRRFEKLIGVKDTPSELFEPGEVDYSKFSRVINYVGPGTYESLIMVIKQTVFSMIWEDQQKAFNK